jgi:ADP-ribose pyrophosphatase YjhB (NUDIX family)
VTATVWRPPPTVRPVAVRTDDGTIKGWRPLGGTIEFGERAADALKREFAEELGVTLEEPTLLCVLESLYRHHDTPGHEIVFVFEARLADEAAYGKDRFTFDDGGVRNEVRWVASARFRAGQEQLFPAGMLELLEKS